MATDKARFLVTVINETVHPDDESDSYDHEITDEPCSLETALTYLRPCYALSSAPVRSPRDLSGHEWAQTEPYQDSRSGAYYSTSVHFKSVRGGVVRPADLFRLFRLAKLA